MSQEIPSRWQARVRQHVSDTTGDERGHLLADDFRIGRSVRLDFADGSLALFRYAFALRDAELNEVAVFTEHCGYHFFPAEELRVETLASVREERDESESPDAPV